MPRGRVVLIALGEFETLLHPARQILSDVEQHSKLGIAPVEKRAIQVFARRFALGQQTLQFQIGARTFHQLAGAAGVGERMKDERRQRPDDAVRQGRCGSEG